MRINKFFTDKGICSRRDADKFIAAGRIRINGRIAELGDQVSFKDEISLDGKIVSEIQKKPVVIAYHKPVGVVCTTDQRDENNIVDAVGYPERIFPIGRLDQMSEGLILLTNIGDIVNLILRSRYANEKEYLVEVNEAVDDESLKKLAAGIRILGQRTLPCRIERVSPRRVRMILTEGKNRQIRRMMEAVERKVTRLKRTRVMNVEIGDLRVGSYRELSAREMSALFAKLKIDYSMSKSK